jgi:arsenate reductase (thioredoxin)
VSEFHAAAEVNRKAALDDLHTEFDAIYSPEEVEALFNDSLEQIRRSATVESYVGTLAGRLARSRLRARAQSERKLEKTVSEVLFVGLHDSGRWQMAATLMRMYAGDRVSASSAASGEIEDVDPVVKEALSEVGADPADLYSKPLTQELLSAADVVVTMGRA